MISCSIAKILAIISTILALVFIFLYGHLKIRHLKICQNLKDASESFAKQSKELDDLRKKKADFFDDKEEENTKSIIVAFNQKGVITYINDYALEFFGFKKTELVHHNILGTIFPPPKKQYIAQPTIVEKILLNPQLYVDM